MNWQRIKCAVFGHKLVAVGERLGIAGAHNCTRCDYHSPAVVWPRRMVKPSPSPPPMPQIHLALNRIADARVSLERGEAAWCATQIEDAIRSAEFFIKAARDALNSQPESPTDRTDAGSPDTATTWRGGPIPHIPQPT
ncbi:hypothetical protein HHL21_12160 [Massilia sp. RP-1-19]|uniref:Uncharacterized protein n=1 Tax=Massilia polaris TaxID=2728846 RepID=A0A848HKQ7_9BURK|nr:hypothetical protein [Massilia polaris]NML61814.1 hypothetical protein [Massilia polaris]